MRSPTITMVMQPLSLPSVILAAMALLLIIGSGGTVSTTGGGSGGSGGGSGTATMLTSVHAFQLPSTARAPRAAPAAAAAAAGGRIGGGGGSRAAAPSAMVRRPTAAPALASVSVPIFESGSSTFRPIGSSSSRPSFSSPFSHFSRSSSSISSSSSRSTTALHMFTGIIEEMGQVISLQQRNDMKLWDGSEGSGTELTVKGEVVLEGAYLGCSIAVNGVCLTATSLDPATSTFTVGLAPETLRRTYLSTLTPGTPLNLERASEIGGRNSGHFVQGHVDGVGTVIDRWVDQDSLFYKVEVEPDMLKYIVPKGFVAVDGTSLTVCEVDAKQNWFTFMLVEYTQKHIIIPGKGVGDKVNIEVDVLGKYSESALATLVPRIEELEGTVNALVRELKEMKEATNAKSSGGMATTTATVAVAAKQPSEPKRRGSTHTLAAAPVSGGSIDDWRLLPNNSISGLARDNPSTDISDGNDITTSAIVKPELACEGATVQTRSGILYKLGKPAGVAKVQPTEQKKDERPTELFAEAEAKARLEASKKKQELESEEAYIKEKAKAMRFSHIEAMAEDAVQKAGEAAEKVIAEKEDEEEVVEEESEDEEVAESVAEITDAAAPNEEETKVEEESEEEVTELVGEAMAEDAVKKADDAAEKVTAEKEVVVEEDEEEEVVESVAEATETAAPEEEDTEVEEEAEEEVTEPIAEVTDAAPAEEEAVPASEVEAEPEPPKPKKSKKVQVIGVSW